MCRLVIVNNRHGWNRGRYLRRQHVRYQRGVGCHQHGVAGDRDECGRIGFRRVRHAGLHVG
jgi:hypothetical protein